MNKQNLGSMVRLAMVFGLALQFTHSTVTFGLGAGPTKPPTKPPVAPPVKPPVTPPVKPGPVTPAPVTQTSCDKSVVVPGDTIATEHTYIVNGKPVTQKQFCYNITNGTGSCLKLASCNPKTDSKNVTCKVPGATTGRDGTVLTGTCKEDKASSCVVNFPKFCN